MRILVTGGLGSSVLTWLIITSMLDTRYSCWTTSPPAERKTFTPRPSWWSWIYVITPVLLMFLASFALT